MKHSHILVTYLMFCFVIATNVPQVIGAEYHPEYSSYEPKKYEHHHHEHHSNHDYHPPPAAPKKANVDINIPLDFGTLAKLGIVGLTQLKLLFALGKIAGAGLGVGALGLSQLGKIALSVAPVHKSGIAIDIGAPHPPTHYEAKSHSHYERSEKEY